MSFTRCLLAACLGSWLFCSLLNAQQPVSSPSSTVVPRLVNFSGKAADTQGKAISGIAGVTFAIYKDQSEGAPLWFETQNVKADTKGNYTVQLGVTKPEGLPLDLFASGEARWLGVKLELPGEVEQPRVLLVSVPYALKASDADTVGGKPASAFVLAPTGAGADAGASAPGSAKSTAGKSKAEPLFTSSGTTNYIPIFTDSTGDIGNSTIYQSTAGNVGIGFSNPQQRLVIGAPAGGTVLNATNLSDQDLNVIVTAPGATDKHTYFGPSVATNLTLGVGGLEKMRITSSGNVGIGDPNPQQRLVIGAPAGGTVLNATNLSDQDLNVIVSAPGASDKHTYFGPSVATNLTLGVGGAEKVRITNAGRVGIGTTTPAYALDVNGSIGAGGITSSATGFGVYATGANGVYGFSDDSSGNGVWGVNPNHTGVYGDGVYGVWGHSATHIGVVGASYGTDDTSDGVYGATTSGSGFGVVGINNGGGVGVSGISSDNAGVYAQSGTGWAVDALGTGSATGVLAGSSAGYAGWFNGDVEVDGNLSKGGGSFKIDHPLDPANKYLYHSFVESPDMMNIYNGNVTTDAQGDAVVHLPEWFETLNRDFRYQLTVIGQFAQAMVASKIANRQFTIKTDKPDVEVSWQVTGIRQDAWANAHRIPVEEEKPELERGSYLHPELYGAPEEKGVLWATAPKAMKRWKEARAKAAAKGEEAPARP